MNVPRSEYDTEIEEGPRRDVLPLELDDGTRMTCTSIAGGARSTNGVPDFLYLEIGKDGDEGELHRYVSSLSIQKALQVETGDLAHLHGLINLACLEYDNGIASMTPERRAALDRIQLRVEHTIGRPTGEPTDPVPPPPLTLLERARAELEKEVEKTILCNPGDRTDAELQTLALFVAASESRRASSPLLSMLAASAGGFLSQRIGAAAATARRERHDDTEPPERSTKRAPRRKGKPQPKRKR